MSMIGAIEKPVNQWKKADLRDLTSVVQELRVLLKTPAVVFLEGDLGTGKTTLVQSFIGKKNNSGPVSSPTYTLVNDYEETLHSDLYRLEDASELVHLELDLNTQGKRFVLFEWGYQYRQVIFRELGQDFFYFLLKIEVDKQQELRDYSLFQLMAD